MNSTGTSYGLALASGVNAYLPLLSFAIGVRYFHWFTVNQNFAFITQDKFMIALVILAILDIIADKIPTVSLVEMLHSHYLLPWGATPRPGTAYMRPTRPQHI